MAKSTANSIVGECCDDSYRDKRDGKVNNDTMGKIRDNVRETAKRRGVDLPDDRELDRQIRDYVENQGRRIDPSGVIY